MFGKSISLSVAAAALAAMTVTATAQTKPQRHYRQTLAQQYSDERPPLTVNRRSFLDPGPVVPVGSMSNYVTANTVFVQTSDQNYARSKYGNAELPRPLEVPGRPQPVLEFETPRLD
ncbi:hypothetical protein [Methylocapsa palsarum]|uniref:Uncharacterized protein n=1 Tax=Methylocapsa palsarum TaxID=1612308 RepID=A0A1I4BJD6_9HYPH|nr:hypothetical protein [Methylocapsa palsarum]SFK68051.1 hypothetical protein SAMN05444581_1154 [Methylocapsa palsarum]